MNTPICLFRFAMVLLLGCAVWQSASANVLDEHCVVNILNQTVSVNPKGGWAVGNLPTNMGKVRARATCLKQGGTFSGASDYFKPVKDSLVLVPNIQFEAIEPTPVKLQVAEPTTDTMSGQGSTVPLKVLAVYRDHSTVDVTAASKGTNYSSSNSKIVSITAEGVMTAVASGTVIITVRKDEVSAFKRMTVLTNGDADNDGIPDDFERNNGLNPNDPLDALEDFDTDGLTAYQEYRLGTNFSIADSDSDGLSDGEETSP